MTTDIVELNHFIVLIEQSSAEKTVVEKCGFDEGVIGFAFYGSGNVELEISYHDKKANFHSTTGMAICFYGNQHVEFAHKISPNRPLQCISVFSKVKTLHQLPEQESEIFHNQLAALVHAQDDFVQGPHFLMNAEMQLAVHKVLHNPYSGATRVMFIKSQVTELLSHFFGLLADLKGSPVKDPDREKLLLAKDIIANNIVTPPSLQQLSKQIGLNSFKLKKNFKELFGVPVFKYLQNERLSKAHDLLREGQMGIQEAAWAVGYESLSSFSNAFSKKFGYRPSEVKK